MSDQLQNKLDHAVANENINDVMPMLLGYAAGCAVLSGLPQAQFQFMAKEVIAAVYAGNIVPSKDKRN